jgi:hypothetical protein
LASGNADPAGCRTAFEVRLAVDLTARKETQTIGANLTGVWALSPPRTNELI